MDIQESNEVVVQAEVPKNDDEMKSKQEDASSSETSSYHSDNEGLGDKIKINGVDMELGDLSEDDVEDLGAMMDEGETQGPNSYARFKTQHEIAPEEIEKVAPKIDKLDDLD